MTLPNWLAGTVLVEQLELKWLRHVLRYVTVGRGYRDGSVEDIPPWLMALFCVMCVLRDTSGAVNTQPSSVFATAMDFTFINCHLSTHITLVTSATALPMGLNQQFQLQVRILSSSFIQKNSIFWEFDPCFILKSLNIVDFLLFFLMHDDIIIRNPKSLNLIG